MTCLEVRVATAFIALFHCCAHSCCDDSYLPLHFDYYRYMLQSLFSAAMFSGLTERAVLLAHIAWATPATLRWCCHSKLSCSFRADASACGHRHRQPVKAIASKKRCTQQKNRVLAYHITSFNSGTQTIEFEARVHEVREQDTQCVHICLDWAILLLWYSATYHHSQRIT
jgi:hypothetical protein